jgi:membrane-bound metal-dependent hydrolase YbcI (DUF457 family)
MGLAPDADMLPALVRTDWAFLQAVSEHRASLLHTPPFALVAGLATLLLRGRDRWLWAAVACFAVLGHLVLDSITIGPGVMWLYPWSETFYGLRLADTRYGRDWGDAWLVRYITHPLFLSEVALLGAATFVARRTTKSTKTV